MKVKVRRIGGMWLTFVPRSNNCWASYDWTTAFAWALQAQGLSVKGLGPDV